MKTKELRKKFYRIVIASVVFSLLLMNIVFVTFMFVNNEVHKDNYRSYLHETTRIRSELYVNTIISEMEGFRISILGKVDIRVNNFLSVVINMIESEMLEGERLRTEIAKISAYNIYQSIFLYNEEEGSFELFYGGHEVLKLEGIDDDYVHSFLQQHYVSATERVVDQGLIVGIYFDNYWIDETTRNMSLDFARGITLEDGEYVWISEILNYEGGDNFARRILYPEDIEREGEYSSTNTQDLNGNYPYQIILNDIKESGDSYLLYNFENTGNKMSYIKLYQYYNWLVVTGILTERIEIELQKEQDENFGLFKQQILIFVAITLAVMITLMLSIFLIEKYRFRQFTAYTEILKTQTKEYEEQISELRVYSDIDALTGVYTRRYMEASLKEIFEQSRKTLKAYAIILIDIDFFKNVNDTYGHDAGDWVLREVATVLQANASEGDILTRYGGEEFLLIVNKKNTSSILKYAEKLRKAVESNKCVYGENSIYSTISLGVSYFNIKDKTYANAMIRADRALYRSKEGGRNRVVIDETHT